jgi:hypothetical protein
MLAPKILRYLNNGILFVMNTPQEDEDYLTRGNEIFTLPRWFFRMFHTIV